MMENCSVATEALFILVKANSRSGNSVRMMVTRLTAINRKSLLRSRYFDFRINMALKASNPNQAEREKVRARRMMPRLNNISAG